MSICEFTGGECKLQPLKDKIDNINSAERTFRESAIDSPTLVGQKDLEKTADARRLQADKLQAQLNRQACPNCWNKG